MTHRLLRWFAFGHLPVELQPVSQQFHILAKTMDREVPDGPEKTAGLRKLLESKDCMVRAMLDTEVE